MNGLQPPVSPSLSQRNGLCKRCLYILVADFIKSGQNTAAGGGGCNNTLPTEIRIVIQSLVCKAYDRSARPLGNNGSHLRSRSKFKNIVSGLPSLRRGELSASDYAMAGRHQHVWVND